MNPHINKIPNNQLSTIPLITGVVLVVLLAIFIRGNLAPIEPIPASHSSTVFSAERAKTMLAEMLLDEQPHPLDSAAIRITESRLIKLLRAMGYQEEIQQTDICHDYGKRGVHCTNVRNIIVTIEGTNETTTETTGILLSAHYDSVDAGSGASDAGAAVATLLEIARLLSNELQPKNTIVLLFNEGEEYGLFGARAFMQKHPLAKTLKLAINIEARGSKGQSVMFETGEKSGWLVSEYIKQTPKPLSSSLFYEVYKILPNDTDLTVFKAYGLQGLNFAHAENLAHYHTPLDNLENLTLGTIQHHGDNVWGVLKAIMNYDLTSNTLDENNLVYTDILGTFMLEWHEGTSLILSFIALIILVVAVIRITKIKMLDQLSLRRGVYLFFLLIILVPGTAYLIQQLIVFLSTTNSPWLTNNFPMQLALWSGSASIAIAISRLLTKNKNPLSLLVGLTCCWIVLALVTSYLAVGISYLFIIPSLVTAVILFIFPQLEKWFPKYHNYIIYLLHMFTIAIIFLPIVYTLEIMVTYQMSAAIGAMFAFVLIGFVPMTAFASTNTSSIKKITGTLIILFLVGASWTLQQPSYDKVSPQALNVYHLQDNENQSWIIAGHKYSPLTESLSEAMGTPENHSLLPWSTFERFSAQTKSANLLPITFDKSDTSISDIQNEISLKVEVSNKNLRELTFFVKKNTNINNIKFFGKDYSMKDRETWGSGYHQFRCIGIQCEKSEISITKAIDREIEIFVLQSLQGLPESDNKFIKNRGKNTHQSQFGDRTMIITKIEM